MTDLLLFPDATATAIGYLAAALGGVHVGSQVPDNRPSSFVNVRRGGGVRSNVVVDNALLLIETWAPDAPAAMTLAQLARAHLHAMAGAVIDGVTVYRVDEVSGPSDFPDPISNQPRAVFTVQIQLRGAVAAGS